VKGRYPKVREATRARGMVLSREAAGSIASVRAPDLRWLVRVSVPFSYAASKNHIWTWRSRDVVANRRESSAFRERLTNEIRAAVFGRRVATNKLWVDIFVQKPNHKGDAVNVVNLVCDAIKDATGLDDRWYSVRSVDWQIVKDGGRLFVGIGQEDVEHAQACSTCGRVLALAMFARNRSNQRGLARVCNDCRRVRS